MRPLLLPALQPSPDAPARHGVAGLWRTIDDRTGGSRRVVGPTEVDPVREACPDDRKDHRTLGLELVRELVRDGGAPQVRGNVAFPFSTQTWLRYHGS